MINVYTELNSDFLESLLEFFESFDYTICYWSKRSNNASKLCILHYPQSSNQASNDLILYTELNLVL